MIAGLLFMGGLRRSEVSALEWRDVSDARDGDGVLLTVRTSKTNQEGDAADVRYLKNGAAKAIRTVRADRPDAAPTDRVVGLSPLQIQRLWPGNIVKPHGPPRGSVRRPPGRCPLDPRGKRNAPLCAAWRPGNTVSRGRPPLADQIRAAARSRRIQRISPVEERQLVAHAGPRPKLVTGPVVTQTARERDGSPPVHPRHRERPCAG